jgi:hypothetical protein
MGGDGVGYLLPLPKTIGSPDDDIVKESKVMCLKVFLVGGT